MVELSTSKRDIRGDRANYDEQLGLERIPCGSQLTIPDTAGTSTDPVGNYIHTWFSKPKQARHSADFSYPLVPFISCSSLSPISLFLIHNSTILTRTQSQVIPLYLSMPWSWVITECSIHRVQYTPNIVCHPVILMITSWPWNVASACSVPPYQSTATSQFSIKTSNVKSPCHIPTVSR